MTTKTWQWLRIAVPGMAMTLLAACGGVSSESAPPPVTYDASATAGTGGTVTPASATVNPGGTATFTVTPNSGYVISSVGRS